MSAHATVVSAALRERTRSVIPRETIRANRLVQLVHRAGAKVFGDHVGAGNQLTVTVNGTVSAGGTGNQLLGKIVKPGDPDNSVMIIRMTATTSPPCRTCRP